VRGDDIQPNGLFSYGSLEDRVPANHPLRPIRQIVDESLKEMSGRFRLRQARNRKLLADKPFTVDGTLIEAWAGRKRAWVIWEVLTENRNGLVVHV
jgi:hypothetical protein